jgi:TatD DNase family protein
VTGTGPAGHGDGDPGAVPAAGRASAGAAEPSSALRWIDDHCHLDPDPDTAARTVQAAREAGVERMVNIGTDVESSRAAIRVARTHDGVWATAGVHPHDAVGGIDGLADLLLEPEVVAVGECGLDYHYDHSPRADQRAVFAAQVVLAIAHDLALVIHTREAWDDTFAILADTGTPERTVFHCFTGGAPEAERALAVGGHLSFSGIATFPSAADVREAAAHCPVDRLLVETDAPFLAPVPHRGKPNEPALLPVVGAAVAAAKNLPVEGVAAATWTNAARVYRL